MAETSKDSRSESSWSETRALTSVNLTFFLEDLPSEEPNTCFFGALNHKAWSAQHAQLNTQTHFVGVHS